MTYGYARVSSRDQNLDRQIIALKNKGVEEHNIFTDKSTGSNFVRPGYKKLINTIQKGDVIIIKSIDRLGRNYEEITNQWHYITKDLQVDICVIDMPLLDTSYCKDILGSFISDLVLQILSFQAEQERNQIKARQAEGIAAAKERGVRFGRPRKEPPSNFEDLYQRYLRSEPLSSLIQDCPGMSVSTLRLRLLERKALDDID